ncbi:MAG TPA: hypothetical protein VFB06_02900 [Streptosporangiaceae bacterium]|nr:hypothetical protein [Streptosporangiaceae bacterium]
MFEVYPLPASACERRPRAPSAKQADTSRMLAVLFDGLRVGA